MLGSNGSGKSTLLNLISGYESPDYGEVTYKDEKLSKLDFSYTHDIFFVHEKIDYLIPMTVNEYIEILKEQIPLWDQNLFEQMVTDRKINLEVNFQNLSRGQKMQVVLMIGLASKAKVLLLDEITSVIDIYGRKYFLDLLEKHVQAGNTVVITTNIINELEFYTDKLIVIKDKKIALNKTVDEIPELFVKIRKQKDKDHEVFSRSDCVWAGINSDKSVSYIVPLSTYERLNLNEEIVDRRVSTLEDVFIYYFNKHEEKEEPNENAA